MYSLPDLFLIYNNWMSYEALLAQNKILAYFTLDTSANVQANPLLQPSEYAIFIFHNHYPAIYYQAIFDHFRHCLPEQTKPGNIRIFLNKKQLPSQIPIGLHLQNQSVACFTVGVDLAICVPEAFRIIKNSWKKAFQVINSNRRCDYVKTRLSEKQLKQKFKMYCEGVSHGLQKEGLYEGNNMIVKGFFKGEIIERKFGLAQFSTMNQIVGGLFCLGEVGQKYRIKSHGVEIDTKMRSKVFLDEWSYNDGYCYLKLEQK